MKKIIKLIVLVIAIVAIIGVSTVTEFLKDHGIEIPSELDGIVTTETSVLLAGPYSVKRVVDGDTIVVTINGKNEKVRMIGVNTPESVHTDESKNTKEGKITSDYTKDMLTGTEVYLEYDADKYDDYNRLLAYVYISEDEMYNLHLIEEGYAQVMTIEPNTKYEATFSKAETEAKNNYIGFWADVWNNENY